MDFRPRFNRSLAIALVAAFLISTGPTPARAAGIGDYVAPFQSLVSTFENVFAQLVALVEPHHTVSVEISPAAVGTWHASGKTASAAAFNSIVATSQPTASPTTVHIDTSPKASTPSASRATSKVGHSVSTTSAGAVLGSSTTDAVVTQSELETTINQASNALRQLIYADTGTIGKGQYSTGGYTNNLALSNKIDQLSGTTLTNVIVNGVSGLTAANIPDLSSQYLPLSGGIITGGLTVTGSFSGGSISLNTSSSTNLIAQTASLGSLTLGAALSVANGGTGTTSATGAAANLQFLFPSASTATARSLTAKLSDTVSVKDFGAKGDGVTDDTVAIQNAMAYASTTMNGAATIYFPTGTYEVSAPIVANSSVQLDPNAIIQATAPMTAVIEMGPVSPSRGTGTWLENVSFNGGTIDANNEADDGLFLRHYQQIALNDVMVKNFLVVGFHYGDPTLNGSSAGVIANDLYTFRSTGSIPTGSAGVLMDTNSSDNQLSNSTFTGADVGINVAGGGGDFFDNVHVWANAPGSMSIGFEDNGSWNHWKACAVDGPSKYGMYITKYGSSVIDCRFNTQLNTGEVGIYFAESGPTSAVIGNDFLAFNGGAWQTDIVASSSATGLQVYGNVESGVTSPSNIDLNAGFINTDEYSGYKQNGQMILYASSSLSNLDVGFMAGAATTTTGTKNVGVGRQALALNTTGSSNVAVGYQAGGMMSVNNQNTLIGAQAASGHSGGSDNVAVGSLTLNGLGGGGNNTVVGFEAGNGDSGGTSNLFLGYEAASTTSTGSNNILIGSGNSLGLDLPSVNGSNQLDIGNLIYGTGINGTFSTISTGNIGIGTTTPYSRLTVWGTDTASSTLTFNIVNNASTTVFAVFDGGNAQLSGTLTQSSDRRLKTNILTLDASSSLASINSLMPVAYDWLDPEKGGVRQYGFIAQQVEQVFPNLVSTTSATALTPDGTLGLNYIGLIAPLVEAVQQLSAELQSLTTTVQGFAQSFTSKQVTATQRLCVDKSDGSPVCLTGDQLAGILSGTPSVQISAPTPPTISRTTTPPSIDIQGSNPAAINVGDTYTDLGAIVTDSQGHDLSYRTFINGVLSGNILIDTTQVATDTIDYVATDTWGNTATSTRTVIVQAASSSPSLQ